MNEALVLYPTPAIGHLISMVELGKLLVTQQSSLTIHILVLAPPYNAGTTAPYISTVSATYPSIKFHHLPTITLASTTATNHETLTFEVIRLSNPNVQQALLSLSQSYTIRAFVMDFFCTAALSVANELSIPGYHFFTSGACCLCFIMYLPILHQKTSKCFRDLNTFLHIPGIPPIHSSDVPKPVLDREDKAYQYFVESSSRFPESAGIIVNTFELLENRATKAISDGSCVPSNRTPPIYCIGPLAVADNRKGGAKTSDDSMAQCFAWLDSQPSRSVVFLCFGSLGLFSRDQLREIATGLERSGQRFLWVVRSPPSDGKSLAVIKQEDPDLDSLLPDSFLSRTSEKGFVVKTWAPQVAVLNHGSVGGFVTHCGWNSVLEAVCAGVPMVAWPQYAEQRLNKVLLVEEMKLALPMDESENGFVSAAELEKRVRGLMESEEGKFVREQTIAMRDGAKAAMSKGGSSRLALAELVESWKLVGI
ncbi:hypothetical protein K2173_028400 [Erythroxylum novogranatense]|uniref:Glycosyltransferase n=1 Tax=Erythroxylum novogranatense TaxID=1862640 RepID=A0AAV8U5T3_9ROSI|nr:hypothetical protein K2173_028400 [Erythroxylum novogranatense]